MTVGGSCFAERRRFSSFCSPATYTENGDSTPFPSILPASFSFFLSVQLSLLVSLDEETANKVASNPLTSVPHLCMPEPWDWRHVATSSRREQHPPPVKFTRAHFPRLHLIPTPRRGRVVSAVVVSSLFPRIERVYSRGDSSWEAPRAFPNSPPLS